MLEESGKMIADSAGRLGAVVQELRELLVRAIVPSLRVDLTILRVSARGRARLHPLTG